MDTLSYKTVSANSQSSNKAWLLVDAEGQSLGRLASKIAKMLRGKHKTNFTPHADCGDNVVVLNAEKVVLTGNKWNDKGYLRYTEYPGGQRSVTAKQMYDKDPARLVEKAVKGMLPKNKLASKQIKNMRVFVGSEHDVQAQKPKEININEFK